MTKRHLEMLSELLDTVSEYLTEVEALELNPDLLKKTQDLRPIVEGFNDLVREEIHV